MNFADGLKAAYETKWSFINTFNVQFVFNEFGLKDSIGWNESDARYVNLNIVSIDTPQFTNQPIEQFVANKWVIGNGRDELYRFSITFRDSDSMDLYRKFVSLYQITRENYFDYAKFIVILTKEGDWYNEQDKKLLTLNETIVESVSQLQFNNTTESQIAEFTVNFKCTFPELTK